MSSDFTNEVLAWIRGAVLLLFILNIGLYIQNKKRLFLNYSLYLLFVFLFMLKPVASDSLKEFYDIFEYSFLFLAFVFYVDFERVLFETRGLVPTWDRYLRVKKFSFLLLSVVIPFIYFFLGLDVLMLCFFVFLNLLNFFVVKTYFVFSKIKDREVIFFILGDGFFLLLSNVGLYLKLVDGYGLVFLSFDPKIFIYFGAIIETLIFTNLMRNIFKLNLSKKSNLKLQFALKQQEIAEFKMIALQSQMNPHFLFNSLNSINNFVLKNKKEEASDYITAFSKLVRKILKNSESLEISLLEEIQVLEMYIRLEKTRLIGGFIFDKSIDKRLKLERVMVPPLFLQPYIENSIWHGLSGKEGNKRIKFDVTKIEDKVHISIEDNGLGINDEMIQKNRRSSKRKFFGSHASEKRIKLMYGIDNVNIDIKSINNIKESGTQVTIIFPIRKK